MINQNLLNQLADYANIVWGESAEASTDTYLNYGIVKSAHYELYLTHEQLQNAEADQDTLDLFETVFDEGHAHIDRPCRVNIPGYWGFSYAFGTIKGYGMTRLGNHEFDILNYGELRGFFFVEVSDTYGKPGATKIQRVPTQYVLMNATKDNPGPYLPRTFEWEEQEVSFDTVTATRFSVEADALIQALKSLKPAPVTKHGGIPIAQNMLVIEPEDSRVRLWTLDADWGLTESFISATVEADAPIVVEFSTFKELAALSEGLIDCELTSHSKLGECLAMRNGGSISRTVTRPYADIPQVVNLDSAVAWATVETKALIDALNFAKLALGDSDRLDFIQFALRDNNQLQVYGLDMSHVNVATLEILSQAEVPAIDGFSIEPKALNAAMKGWKESTVVSIALLIDKDGCLDRVVFNDGESRTVVGAKGGLRTDPCTLIKEQDGPGLVFKADVFSNDLVKAFKTLTTSETKGWENHFVGKLDGYTLTDWTGKKQIAVLGESAFDAPTGVHAGISLKALQSARAIGSYAERYRKSQPSKHLKSIVETIAFYTVDAGRYGNLAGLGFFQWGAYTSFYVLPVDTANGRVIQPSDPVPVQPIPSPVASDEQPAATTQPEEQETMTNQPTPAPATTQPEEQETMTNQPTPAPVPQETLEIIEFHIKAGFGTIMSQDEINRFVSMPVHRLEKLRAANRFIHDEIRDLEDELDYLEAINCPEQAAREVLLGLQTLVYHAERFAYPEEIDGKEYCDMWIERHEFRHALNKYLQAQPSQPAPVAKPAKVQPEVTLTITESAKIAKRVLSSTFPGVKFSVRKTAGYAVRVEWTDGPTTKQVQAALEPIRAGHNLNRDSMTDYAGYVTDTPVLFEGKLTQFEFGGYEGLPWLDRVQSKESRLDMGRKLAAERGLNFDDETPAPWNFWRDVRELWAEMDFTPARATAPVAPSGNPQPSQPAESAGAVSWELSKKSPTQPGWFWFSGDTKPIKDQLKAHGCRWSSKRHQWYFVTTPEAPDVLPPALLDYLQAPPSQPVPTSKPAPVASDKQPAESVVSNAVVSSVPPAKAPASLAVKFRKAADTLTNQIEAKLAPRRENTYKQVNQATLARRDGWNMQALQSALRCLADGWDNDTLTPLQRRITTKKQLELILYHYRLFAHPYHNPQEDGRIDPERDMETIERDYNYQVRQGALFPCASFDEYWQLVLEVADMAKGGSSYDSKAAAIASKQQALALAQTASYFPTPSDLVALMLYEADIQPDDKILEPSAGAGHIADFIHSEYPNNSLQCVEVWGRAVEVLQLKGHTVEQTDFLQYEAAGWNKIIMNPPFNQLADIDHVQHAYNLLAPGGRIVAIMSNSFTFRRDKKAGNFRQWLDTVGAYADLPDDTFKASDRPTGVKTCLVVIDKPTA